MFIIGGWPLGRCSCDEEQQDVNARGKWQHQNCSSRWQCGIPIHSHGPPCQSCHPDTTQPPLLLAELKLFSQVLLHTFERKCLQSIRPVPQEFVSVLVRERVYECGCECIFISVCYVCPNGCCCSIYVRPSGGAKPEERRCLVTHHTQSLNIRTIIHTYVLRT